MGVPFRTGFSSCIAAAIGVLATASTPSLPAAAKETVRTEIVAQTDAPVRIDSCDAGLAVDVDDAEKVTEYVNFTNTGTQNLTGVEFRFDLLDAAGATLSSVTGPLNGKYPANVRIKPKLSFETQQPLTVDSVRCSVYAARFADGSVWQSKLPVATPAPSPVPTLPH